MKHAAQGAGQLEFTPEQASKIIERLAERTTDVCPGCKKTQMILLGGISLIPLHVPTNLLEERSVLPNIVVLCADCGLTRFFNVHALNLADVLGMAPAGTPIRPDKPNKEERHG